MSTMKTPPTQFLEFLNSIQKEVMWNNSRAKIKHCSIMADYKEGGYKDIDIPSNSWQRKSHGQFSLLENTVHMVTCTSWGKLNFSL